VRLAAPDGRGVEIWQDSAFDWIQVCTGTAPPGKRRPKLAVEPMTCPPDAFRSRTGLHVLEPGRGVETTWGIAAS